MYFVFTCMPGESYRRLFWSLLCRGCTSGGVYVPCMPGESYRRSLRSLLLCLCVVFWALINSLVCCLFTTKPNQQIWDRGKSVHMEVFMSLINNFGRDKLLKELAHAGLAKTKKLKTFFFFFFFFTYDFCVALICALALLRYFEICQFKTNCSGLKTDWGSPYGVQIFTECVLRHSRFCWLGLQTIDNGVVSGT